LNENYQIGIIGGGLAGLSMSIQLARSGYRVILFEKETYPFHRVCGEYISLESWDFLLSLGVDLAKMNLPVIRQLHLSGNNGKSVQQQLPLGGFGISRYKLDACLAGLAGQAGVYIAENTRVNDIAFDNNEFTIDAGKEIYRVKMAAGSFGKRSNLDVKWKRPFALAAKNKLNNYVGIKYHVLYPGFPDNLIGLYLFNNGYCGIVKVEGEYYNLCYLTTADNLRRNNNSIAEMEKNILRQNPMLEKIFSEAEKWQDEPLTISQISFDKKLQVDHHVLMIGDAAGMITPLCGNGMSMALHASKLAASQVDLLLQGKISREKMEKAYSFQWRKEFGWRLKMGRFIQRLFSIGWLTDLFIGAGRRFPGLVRWMIKQTHGKKI
jgi:menaquinone-9 beta-reductase